MALMPNRKVFHDAPKAPLDAQELGWNDIVDYDRACHLTGWSHGEIEALDDSWLLRGVLGAWKANDRDRYVGYRSIIEHRMAVLRSTRRP